MSKKKPAPKDRKAAAKKTKPPKAKAPSRAHSAASSRATKPRDKKLPGFEQPKNQRLELLCESLDTQRTVINDAKRIEKSDKAAALQEMTRTGLLAFKHAGIELARIPGADTIRVHVVKDEGEMEAEGEATTEQATDDRDDEVPF